MKRKSLFALLTSLAAVSALLFALSPAAQAVDPARDYVACVFEGSTTTFTPIESPADDLNDTGSHGPGHSYPTPAGPIPTETLPVVGPLLDVEGGTGASEYIFETHPNPTLPTACVHADSDGATQELVTEQQGDDSGVYEAGILANGTYQNLVCGTGSTNGEATLTIVPNSPLNVPNATNSEADSIVAGYFIQFVAGQGAGAFAGNVVKGTDSRPAVGVTIVDIHPTPADPGGDGVGCVDTAVQAFDVDGMTAGTTDSGIVSGPIDPELDKFKD